MSEEIAVEIEQGGDVDANLKSDTSHGDLCVTKEQNVWMQWLTEQEAKGNTLKKMCERFDRDWPGLKDRMRSGAAVLELSPDKQHAPGLWEAADIVWDAHKYRTYPSDAEWAALRTALRHTAPSAPERIQQLEVEYERMRTLYAELMDALDPLMDEWNLDGSECTPNQTVARRIYDVVANINAATKQKDES